MSVEKEKTKVPRGISLKAVNIFKDSRFYQVTKQVNLDGTLNLMIKLYANSLDRSSL